MKKPLFLKEEMQLYINILEVNNINPPEQIKILEIMKDIKKSNIRNDFDLDYRIQNIVELFRINKKLFNQMQQENKFIYYDAEQLECFILNSRCEKTIKELLELNYFDWITEDADNIYFKYN